MGWFVDLSVCVWEWGSVVSVRVCVVCMYAELSVCHVINHTVL